jgi:hypothetical protein
MATPGQSESGNDLPDYTVPRLTKSQTTFLWLSSRPTIISKPQRPCVIWGQHRAVDDAYSLLGYDVKLMVICDCWMGRASCLHLQGGSWNILGRPTLNVDYTYSYGTLFHLPIHTRRMAVHVLLCTYIDPSSDKCVIRRCHRCANMYLHKPR